jgi:hypothetical protein
MLWALVSSAYVIYLYRKLKAGAELPPAGGAGVPATTDAALDSLERRLSAIEARLAVPSVRDAVR